MIPNNPYTNEPISISNLYNLYFFYKNNNIIIPELFYRYFKSDFCITQFLYENETYLRDISISNYYNNIKHFKDIVNRISEGFSKFSQKDTETKELNKYVALVLPYFYKCKSGDIKFGDCDVTKLTKENIEKLGFMWREENEDLASAARSKSKVEVDEHLGSRTDFISYLNEQIEIPEVSRTGGEEAVSPVDNRTGSKVEPNQTEVKSKVTNPPSANLSKCPTYEPFFSEENIKINNQFTGTIGPSTSYGGGFRNLQIENVERDGKKYNDIVFTYEEKTTGKKVYILWKNILIFL